MYQNYVFQNFKQLDLYRLPSAAVPHYLQGRPPTVVKHCLIRKTNSSRYTKDEVVCTKSLGVFHEMKDTQKYTVNFGRHDNSMVSCSCKDWKKWHIPCKHFFAVFRWEPDWSWNELPLEYRQSCYLCTDNVAIEEYLAAQGVCGTDNPGSAEFSLNVTPTEPSQDIKVDGNDDVGVTSSITADSNDIHDPITMVSTVFVKM